MRYGSIGNVSPFEILALLKAAKQRRLTQAHSEPERRFGNHCKRGRRISDNALLCKACADELVKAKS